MPSLCHLVIELAVPTRDMCPIGQPSSLPSWYSQGVESIVHWLVGRDSLLLTLTLHGFNAYTRHDLLDKLVDPVYFPELFGLNLSGFSPAYGSDFWTRIQLGGEDTQPEKLRLTDITFYIKHCREDFASEDLSGYVLQGRAAFWPFITGFMNYGREIQCDVLFDTSVFRNWQTLPNVPNFRGCTWLINSCENPRFGGLPQEFCYYRDLRWHVENLTFFQPEFDAPG